MLRALIPAARDPKMRPFAQKKNKHLLPLANTPVLFYVLGKLAQAGIRDVGIVTTLGDESLQRAVGDGKNFGVCVTYIPQEGGTRGIAHAVMQARDFLRDEPFVVHLGDNIVLDNIGRIIERFQAEKPACLLAFAKVENPQRFGVPVFEGDKLVRVEERPFHPQSSYAVAGLYCYSPAVHDIFPKLQPSHRGDFEISDVHTYFLEQGHSVTWVELKGWWKDTGNPEDLLEGNRFVLENLIPSLFEREGEIAPSAVIKGNVRIGPRTRILGNSVIIGPTVIGSGCLIKDAYIGPYTSVGDRSEIHGGEIENSILFPEVRIATQKRIQGSILGEEAVIAKEEATRPSGHRLFIGENAIVDL